MVLAITAMGLSLVATSLVYVNLSPRPLRFGRTLLVQTAGFCVNKLLPSGAGAAGTSFLYLQANRLSTVQAGSIVALNNLLGFVGHILLFWLLIGLEPEVLGSLSLQASGSVVVWITVLGVLALAGGTYLARKRLRRFSLQVRSVLKRRSAVGRALLASILLTLCYVVCLVTSAQAIGVHLSWAAAIVVLSASVLATSVIPSPGGIGVAELGAYAGLQMIGIDQQQALTVALLYRVCTFWLPLVVGSVAFVVVIKRGYLRKG